MLKRIFCFILLSAMTQLPAFSDYWWEIDHELRCNNHFKEFIDGAIFTLDSRNVDNGADKSKINQQDPYVLVDTKIVIDGSVKSKTLSSASPKTTRRLCSLGHRGMGAKKNEAVVTAEVKYREFNEDNKKYSRNFLLFIN